MGDQKVPRRLRAYNHSEDNFENTYSDRMQKRGRPYINEL